MDQLLCLDFARAMSALFVRLHNKFSVSKSHALVRKPHPEDAAGHPGSRHKKDDWHIERPLREQMFGHLKRLIPSCGRGLTGNRRIDDTHNNRLLEFPGELNQMLRFSKFHRPPPSRLDRTFFLPSPCPTMNQHKDRIAPDSGAGSDNFDFTASPSFPTKLDELV